MNTKPFRIPAVLAATAIVTAVFVACGSSDTAVVAPQDTTDQVAVNTSETTEPVESKETQVAAVESTEMITETDESKVVDLVLVDDPVTTEADATEADATEADATLEESAEAALLTSYTDYGFALKLDLGADVQIAGWTETEASLTQGIIAFNYGGVTANVVWGPPEERSALTLLADTYNILKASQPAVTFESISDGDVSVSDQAGVYGGFKAVDTSGTAIGGGLIGAWICGDNETAFRMTLTGEDATVVQLRFDRLLENFACSAS